MIDKKFYKTNLYFTKLSPPANYGCIPKIGREKLLLKLEKEGVSEEELEKCKTKNGYGVWLNNGLLLEITELKK